MRLRQESVLGIGGVRVLRALGLKPTVWHINEGHAAFLTLERIRELRVDGHSFEQAQEIVAGSTVFTTHTPVPAGHDIFTHHLLLEVLGNYLHEVDQETMKILSLGNHSGSDTEFNMTALALRCSRFHNGVSAIHGGIASKMESYIWPQIPPHENPIRHVTNGVHVPTFLDRAWSNTFDMTFGSGWRNQLCNANYWNQIDDIPDHTFWSICQTLKEQLFDDIHRRLTEQYCRNGMGHMQIKRHLSMLKDRNTPPMVIGFARRFATYKRATLIFKDRQRLARILSDSNRPVLILFAGKAHPHDGPGQALIREIHEIAASPEFESKVLIIEGYNLSLSRKLVSGVDVWLNNPEYPLEASGTSGEKAAINGVLNLSVGDGWWAEAYSKQDDVANGWIINPHDPGYDPERRDRDEAAELMDILEKSVIPKYFTRDNSGIPKMWVRMAKRSISTILPHFNSARMVIDYLRDYYAPASNHGHNLLTNGGQLGHELATWKSRVRERWHEVNLSLLHHPAEVLLSNETFVIKVNADLNGLAPTDVMVECVFEKGREAGEFSGNHPPVTIQLHPEGEPEQGVQRFSHIGTIDLSGLQNYRIRIYPFHHGLAHRFETGLMTWLKGEHT